MKERENLFRQAAVNRLASPEDLDALVRVVTPKMWMILLPFLLAGIGGLAWSVFGRIPIKVQGAGIIVSPSGISDVVTDAAGRVSRLRVDVGDQIEAGAPIADVSRPDFDDKLRQLDARIETLTERRRSLTGFAERGAQLSESSFAKQRALIDAQIKAALERKDFVAQRLAVQQELLKDGLVTQSAVLGTKQDLTAQELELESLRARLAQLEVQSLDFTRTQEQERASLASALADATRERESLALSRSLAVQVTSPFRGRVIEVKIGPGSLLAPGTPVIALERAETGGGDLEAIVYVSSADGKRIVAGLPAEVVPATVKREEFGFIQGRVRFVSDYPVSPAAVQNRLQNDTLAKMLAGQAQAPFELRIVLQRGATPSGFAWSTRSGPQSAVVAGTLCRTEVVVERQRPITLFIPALKPLFGP